MSAHATFHPGENPVDVLIIGGGLAGMTLACALGGAGVSVALVELSEPAQLTDRTFDGRTTAIAAASKTLLEGIDVWTKMADGAEPILDIRVSDGHSPLFLHYDHRQVGNVPLGYIAENIVIRRALLDRIASISTVVLLTGERVVELDRNAALARATMASGDTLCARVAVATDGRASPTRIGAGIKVTDWRYGQRAIVCTVTHEHDHRGVAQEHFLPAGPFAILPMTGRRSSIVWTERADLAAPLLALNDNDFLAELQHRFGDYLGALEIVGPRFSYPLGLLHAERYVADRLALAGDAAHGMHPIAGQGLNIGWRDVAALAEVVVDALRLGMDPGSVATLERYERWRRFDTAAMLAATDVLNRLFSNDIAPVKLARDAGLAMVNQLPPLKRLFMRHAMGVVGDLPRLVRGEAL